MPTCNLPDCQYCPELTDEQAVDFFLRQSNLIEGIEDDVMLDQARHAWKYLLTEEKLDCGVILKAHKILMNKAKIFPNERGYWRRRPVRIGYEKILGMGLDGKLLVEWVDTGKPAEWRDIPGLMKEWVEHFNHYLTFTERVSEHMTTINLHIRFEHVHPFIDGNGRVGRLLFNWQRLKLGLPLMIIHNEAKKDNYYKWFK